MAGSSISIPWAWMFFSRIRKVNNSPSPHPRSSTDAPRLTHFRIALYSKGRVSDGIFYHSIFLSGHSVFKRNLLQKIFNEMRFFFNFQKKGIVTVGGIDLAIGRIDP